MPRSFTEKELKTRIKNHKAEMRDFRKTVTTELTAATKGEEFAAVTVRNAVSGFTKSHKALLKDLAKLPPKVD